MTLVPGGAIGVLLKSSCLLMNAHDERCGLMREFRSKFNVISPCFNIRSHSDTGKLGSHVAKPLIKWFSNVR